ncbi:MAG: glycosyltransferase [Sphingobacteriales bacterium]|nr:glycosyltransferase [Sphingobacteriales bacterium]MBI3720828.1 glycosyltransferase [Sphingobacteriales bacterium]
MDNKKKIHFVHYDAGPGGMEVLLPVIIKELTQFDFSVYLLRSEKPGVSVYQGMTIPVQYGDDNNLKAFIKAFSYARKYRNEIFHVYNIGPFFLLLFKLAGVKHIVYSIHGTVYWKSELKKYIFKAVWKLALNKRIVFIANSEHSKNEFFKKVSERYAMQVIYNPVDANRFKENKTIRTDNTINIIYAGRLANGKNLYKWIDIALKVHLQFPQTAFNIYGDGALKSEISDYVLHHKAEDYIHLPGFKKDVEQVYQEADVLLFLSEYESFGNVVVESILSGTPVIVSPIPSMKEIFRDYPQFLLSDDIQKWEIEVNDKIAQLETLKKLAAQASKNFAERFGVSQHMNALAEIYENAN